MRKEILIPMLLSTLLGAVGFATQSYADCTKEVAKRGSGETEPGSATLKCAKDILAHIKDGKPRDNYADFLDELKKGWCKTKATMQNPRFEAVRKACQKQIYYASYFLRKILRRRRESN